MKYIIDNIQFLNLKENDNVILKVDILKFRPSEVHAFYKIIREKIPNNIFVIPKQFDLYKSKTEPINKI
jgi:hypothetical protein